MPTILGNFLGTRFSVVIFKNNFGKQLSATTSGGVLAALRSSCSEQLLIIILGAALENNFVDQVWETGVTLCGNFEQKF